jgi:Helicase HerA, central domain
MAELALGGGIDPASHQRTDVPTTVDTSDFTTHGVIVGMTGSGKTGLGVVLIEEVLRAGLPALLIDPKGDLTNLRLMFPGLSGGEFRPWIDEGQAAKESMTPDEFAADQARRWTDGLAGWSLSGADIAALVDAVDMTIYTPGSSSGVPLDIVGSLAPPADLTDTETVADEIEGYVSGLLGLVGIESDPLSSREHILLANLIDHYWRNGVALDLATLVGAVPAPPIRKLGVFEVDQFYPAKDRMALAMKLNGLLASPSFAAWSQGPPIDIDSLLRTADGRPRCAIVTTAHLSDDERQFVTSLVLAKLVTWMRRQTGTTDLRALLYLDEVAGYLPPVANPPTKKPIMTLMKQARAFGVGVVLATQNPVDIDYKAISNAGTWMIGRLQTDRDKQRLLDGMTAAAGGIDVAAIGDTISGLAKREFVLRRAGRDHPDVFTTRWAMSYLRGPLTRDQISRLTPDPEPTPQPSGLQPPSDVMATAAQTSGTPLPPPPPPPLPTSVAGGADVDVTPVMPAVAGKVPIRWVDPAAAWITAVGGTPTGTVFEPAIVARVALRYDETKADLVHDTEFEAVLFPLADRVDPAAAHAVDHDDRDLLASAPAGRVYRLGDAPIDINTFFTTVGRELVDHLVRNLPMTVHHNQTLKLYGRPGELATDFVARCEMVADDRAEADIAKLRSKYETRAGTLARQLAEARSRTEAIREAAAAKEQDDLLSSAGSLLGGLLTGRSSRRRMMSDMVRDAGRAASSSGGAQAKQAESKVARLTADLEALEAELADDVREIDQRWRAAAGDVSSIDIGLEKSDVRVTDLVLAWLPVA